MQVMDCVVNTQEEYISQSIRLGTDRDFRKEIQEKIQAASDVLFEDAEEVRELERFFVMAVDDSFGARV